MTSHFPFLGHETRSVLRDYGEMLGAFAAAVLSMPLLVRSMNSTLLKTPISDLNSDLFLVLSNHLTPVPPILLIAAFALGNRMIAPINPVIAESRQRTIPIPFRTALAARLMLLYAVCLVLPVAAATFQGMVFPTSAEARPWLTGLFLWVVLGMGILSGLTLSLEMTPVRKFRLLRNAAIVFAPTAMNTLINIHCGNTWFSEYPGADVRINLLLTLGLLSVYLPARIQLVIKRAHAGISAFRETPVWLAFSVFFWLFPSKLLIA